MRHCNPYVVVMISLSILLAGLIAAAGCRKKSPPPSQTKSGAVAKEESAPTGSPFSSPVGKTAGVIADAARDELSAPSAESLGRLHVSGIIILFVALVARFLWGWKDALIVSGLGAVPSVLAVLLTEYSRVVLLIPLAGVVILGFALYKRLKEWRTKAAGFDTVANTIEQADTGSKSLGQLVKDRIAETDLTGTVGKALKSLEEKWEKATSK